MDEEIDGYLACKDNDMSIQEESYQYRHLNTSINKNQFLNAYHHTAFQGFSKKQYQCNEINILVDLVILPIIGVLGIFGNIGGILTFSKKLHLTYYSLLFTLAISDLVTTISFILYYSFPHWIDHYTLLEYPICTHVILWSYCLLHISQLIDIYLLVGLSAERYIAICRPFMYRSRKLSSLYYIIPIVFFSLCYSIPIFFEHRVVSVPLEKFHIINKTQEFVGNTTVYVIKHTNLKLTNEYKVIYETVLKLVVKCLVPYILLISTNLLMVRAFCDLNHVPKDEHAEGNFEESHNNQEVEALRLHTSVRGLSQRQSQVNLGYLNLAITMVFLICYSLIWIWAIPDFVSLLNTSPSNSNGDEIDKGNQEHKSDPPWLITVMNVYKVLWVFNSSVNYYLYRLKLLISKGKCNNCCQPKRNRLRRGRVQLQMSLSTKSNKLYTGVSIKT